MFKAQNRPVWALCALLSIWICVIISNSTCRSEETSAASAGSDRPVLILDPGHGGTDGGAVSVTGVRESSINWQITDRIYDLARFMGLKTIRTRDREEIEYPPELKTISARKKWDTRERTRLVNETENCVLLSIHQNYYPLEKPQGIQLLYRDDDLSVRLAEALQRELAVVSPGSEKRRPVRAGKDIYLMTHVNKPAVLVECGFLSNRAEALLLENPSHQKKTAMIIAAVYYDFTGDETA